MKSSLSPARQRLVELMQRLNFGCIEGLQVRDGEPVREAPFRVVHEIRFGKQNGPVPGSAVADFALKKEIVELFEYFDRERSVAIERLEVQHGLPFRMTVAETARV